MRMGVTLTVGDRHMLRHQQKDKEAGGEGLGVVCTRKRLWRDADGNIDNLQMVRRASDVTEMLIEVEVWDLEHLNRIISGLRTKSVVSNVERSFE